MMRTFVLRRQAVRAAEDEHHVLDRQAEQQHGQAVDAQTKAAVRRAAVPGAMVDITKKWTGRQQDWSVIHAQLSIYFAERMPE